LKAVNAYLAEGSLSPNDLAWHEGAPDWIKLGAVNGVKAPAEAFKFDPEEEIPEYFGLTFWGTVALIMFRGLWLGYYAKSWTPVLLAVGLGIPFALLISFLRQKFRGFFKKSDEIATKIFWIVAVLFLIAAVVFFLVNAF